MSIAFAFRQKKTLFNYFKDEYSFVSGFTKPCSLNKQLHLAPIATLTLNAMQ